MTNYYQLPPGPDVPHVVNAVIEIPKGSAHKYEYDKELNVFKLDRTLYSPVHYPGAYGFIPRTLAEDGDPLDVVVIIDGPTFTGCLIEVRPLGVLVMRDDMGLDHKILAVPTNDPPYDGCNECKPTRNSSTTIIRLVIAVRCGQSSIHQAEVACRNTDKCAGPA